jgi:murein DD-endopeptidase MepM/ murein hydrolase activator NlpD
MKSANQTVAGDVRRSVSCTTASPIDGLARAVACLTLFVAAAASGQALYKYQDANGNWIYTDRQPAALQSVEIRELPTGSKPPSVTVDTSVTDGELRFIGHNDYFAHVEVVLVLDDLTGVQLPDAGQVMRWILEPQSEMALLTLPVLAGESEPAAKFRYAVLIGDPRSSHRPERPYRAPFAVAGNFQVTQAYPMAVTHESTGSQYAVDIAMPIGTDIHAARGGVVFEVASTNYRGGVDRERDAPSANLVRILHDDGTHAVYAHLNWNSIRVRPGDKVERGQYIAESGNTGFTTGPHLHFAVLQNVGMRIDSVPVDFEGPNADGVSPRSGMMLTAY